MNRVFIAWFASRVIGLLILGFAATGASNGETPVVAGRLNSPPKADI